MRAGVLLAVLLLAACAGASPSAGPDAVRILATGLRFGGQPYTVAAIDNNADYLAAWQPTDRSSAPPDVDWANEVVIYLGMAGSSSCPETFQHLVVDHEAAHVFGQWDSSATGSRPKDAACTDDLQSQGIALAVSRAVLPAGQFTLTLRETLVCPDCSDHPDQAVVDLP
jgi:hypothetical protein